MQTEDQSHHGIKRITPANWKEVDSVVQYFQMPSEEGWVGAFLKPQLVSAVPKELVVLFEVARGSMIYGWFFYPLLTLATEQCYRVLEPAARMRCQQLHLATKLPIKNGKTRDAKFFELITALVKAGVIEKSDEQHWDVNRNLRNWSSHPSSQSIYPPKMALDALEGTAALLNRLFK